MNRDNLGDRMKSYENITRTYLPSRMPEIVYPRQSRWIYVNDRCGCELCRKCLSYDGNGVILDLSHLPFCPFCGAKMILEERP